MITMTRTSFRRKMRKRMRWERRRIKKRRNESCLMRFRAVLIDRVFNHKFTMREARLRVQPYLSRFVDSKTCPLAAPIDNERTVEGAI